MMTDDIQELLDGGLSDERTAELLHTLSVSPEKREAFRQYMALQGAMATDRLASAMTPAEDAALWGAITGGGAITATRPTPVRTWLARGAALLAAGVVGYILGTTTIIAPVETGTADRRTGAASTQGAGTTPTDAPARVEYRDRIEYRDRVAYRDRVVYKDRVVYRDRIVEREPAQAAAATSVTPVDGASGVGLISSTPAVSDAPVVSAPAVSSPASTPVTLDTLAPSGAAHEKPSSPTLADSLPARSSARGIAETSVQEKNDEWIDEAMADVPSPLTRNGWEATYVERVGLLAPAPVRVEKEDEGFAYRMLGIAYWFGGGRLSFGMRAGYGTFTSVELASRAGSTGLGEEITGIVKSADRVWMEGHLSWRAPLTRTLGVSVEANVGGSTHHTKVAGDVVGTFFVTDNIGLQAGLGLGHYWYSIAAERDAMLEDTPTGGVTSDVRSDYQGLMFEGRYGLFFRF